ncbi:MAG: YfhO family protein [Prevotellaceae bacterium]|jgi:hypothetical protein|nr:YfhO family protein [Prevotellaceae bacterium]
MKNLYLKNCTPYLAAIGIFIVISIGYFTPEIFQNKALYQHDIVTGSNIGSEISKFQNETGEKTLWTNALFGGMPVYQISPGFQSSTVMYHIQKLSFLYVLPSLANLLFILLFGAFLLFMALRINPWLAILGAIGYAFSSYFIIIIQAGHIWKVLTLAYIPPTFAGIIWIYRGKYLGGAIVTAIYFALQLVSNHPQMTYYFGFIVVIYIIREFVVAIKTKKIPAFFKSCVVFAFATGIAFTINLSAMYHTADYSKYSIRGSSELSGNEEDKSTGGLDRSYITGWSYGIGETFSLLIPNVKGGASNILGNNKKTVEKIVSAVRNDSQIPDRAKDNVVQEIAYQPSYWGDQPGTSGPVYAGAFIVFLFILGLFIVKDGIKWVLLSATIISIALSWGHNFNWLTNLFIDYVPYYNKMRAVSSMLVIAELCIPVLAVLTLKEIILNPSIIKHKKNQFYTALGLTGGLTLLFLMFPTTFFSFFSEIESVNYGKLIASDRNMSKLIGIIETVRISIFRADAWRSLLVIAAGAAIILLFANKKINVSAFVALLAILVLVDLWDVNKRYLNGDSFKPKQKSITAITPKTPADEEILKDVDPNYRVLNLTVSTFNDGTTSQYHKSIGGYHGAKMRRYQDIIERYLSRITPQNAQSLATTKQFNVLNMLNTKYIILPAANGSQQLMRNSGALGNAWFVDEVIRVNSADEEIAAIADIDPAKTAVIDKRFESAELNDFKPSDSLSSIQLVEYQPNKLVYKSKTNSKKLAVFSEIYYPKGWYARIDGNETEILRSNYILRAMLIPEGEHTIEFSFDPQTVRVTETAAWIGYILLLGLIIVLIVSRILIIKKNRNTENSLKSDKSSQKLQ